MQHLILAFLINPLLHENHNCVTLIDVTLVVIRITLCILHKLYNIFTYEANQKKILIKIKIRANFLQDLRNTTFGT